MNAIALLRLQSVHNQWINERLYAVCADMTDAERKRDLGAFFRSIHGTFNHLLLTDRVWLGRLRAQPFPAKSLDQELYADFDELRAQRVRTDADISAYIEGVTEKALGQTLHYASFTTSTPKSMPLGVVLTHLFHHQTHHRGQITTLISQLGYDFGDTDLILIPEVDQGRF